mgnify:CR=1 FL=1
MAETIETIVIGAGVVGLATARRLAEAGQEVIILERENAIGSGVSSRNSEVIHAGIYYPTGSVKAKACLAGRDALYAYCAAHGVPHARTGKLIVATTPEQVPQLEAIYRQGLANGVSDLEWLDAPAALALEPALRVHAAILSPSTGIVDSHGLMLAYQGDAEAAGAMIAFNTPFMTARVIDGGFEVATGGPEPMTIICRNLVNAAALAAPILARRIAGLGHEHIPQAYFCKGSYYSISTRVPFSRLIYPVPEQAGLGVHLTLDLAGCGRFGPDTEWVESENYDVDPRRADSFYAAIRTYWPDLPDNALAPAYSGIRPKITPPGAPAADFVISGPAQHGVPGLVNLFGIESPGLTASLAVADLAAEALAA